MDDSNETTVKFLRARLQSERSVSRASRQRVDELAERVAELEEQLKIVSLQRKKAEKATSDVLAILENQGVSDIYDAYDSDSDQDISTECKVGANIKDEDCSINSKGKDHSEDFSGSEIDSSSITGRSLSWKGHKDTPVSFGKYKDSSLRRRNSYAFAGSPKQRLGKSCRQIRHRESRSTGDKSKTEYMAFDAQDNGNTLSSRSSLNCSNGGSFKRLPEDNTSASLEEQRNEINDAAAHGKDMEKALEHQGKLIRRYEEMENAQKEWEEKFRETNSSTPDSNDPGNRSDVTEEREEIKLQSPYPRQTVPSQVPKMQSEMEDIQISRELSKFQPSSFQQPPDGSSQDQKQSINSPAHEFASSMVAEQKRLQNSEDLQRVSSKASYHPPPSPSLKREASPVSSDVGSSFSRGEASGNQNQFYALVPHETPNGLAGVLEALKQAKLSLQSEIGRLPVVEGGAFSKAIVPSTFPPRTVGKVDVPAGCPGVFRLPTDYAIEASKPTILGLSPQLNVGNRFHDVRGAGNSFGPSPDNHFLTCQHTDNMSRSYNRKPFLEPYFDRTIPSASRHNYPTLSSYMNLIPQTLSNGGFSRPIPKGEVRMPPSNPFSFNDNQMRMDMYRK